MWFEFWGWTRTSPLLQAFPSYSFLIIFFDCFKWGCFYSLVANLRTRYESILQVVLRFFLCQRCQIFHPNLEFLCLSFYRFESFSRERTDLVGTLVGSVDNSELGTDSQVDQVVESVLGWLTSYACRSLTECIAIYRIWI